MDLNIKNNANKLIRKPYNLKKDELKEIFDKGEENLIKNYRNNLQLNYKNDFHNIKNEKINTKLKLNENYCENEYLLILFYYFRFRPYSLLHYLNKNDSYLKIKDNQTQISKSANYKMRNIMHENVTNLKKL